MAKKWTPSQKQLSIYDELLKRQNQVRMSILKRRRIIEEEGTGGTLPDLVIPKKARRYRDMTRYRFNSYEEYRKKLAQLKSLYGLNDDALKHFYKTQYRQNIINLVKGWINDILGYKPKPEGYFGKYKEEQIYEANLVAFDGGKYLELYNMLQSLPTEVFMTMYDSGMIPPLKYIYQEMQGNVEFSMVDEFIDTFSEKRRQAVNQENIMIKDLSERSKSVIKGYNKHTRKFKVEE